MHPHSQAISERIIRGAINALIIIMSAELIWALTKMQWLNAFLISVILTIIIAPVFLRRKIPFQIPIEFHIFIIVFIFLTLFLGEVRSFYERIWWWDIMLHMTSGLLLGVMGFLLVYALNEHDRIDVYLRPKFVALFAFLFAVSIGSLWELFEFFMDETFSMNMQKPMLNDPSGLTDTMWDLLMDVVGALIISSMGWWYLNHGSSAFIERWTVKFINKKPHLFISRRNKQEID